MPVDRPLFRRSGEERTRASDAAPVGMSPAGLSPRARSAAKSIDRSLQIEPRLVSTSLLRDASVVSQPRNDADDPFAALVTFQRRRVRRTAIAAGAVAGASIVFVTVSLIVSGPAETFGPQTPVRLPILAFLASLFLLPVVWSAIFRSHRYGISIADDELQVVSWWRTRRYSRDMISAAEPLPAVARLSHGLFSGAGNDRAPFAVWLWPRSGSQREFPLGVTTGTWETVERACHVINLWLGVELDFDRDRAEILRDDT